MKNKIKKISKQIVAFALSVITFFSSMPLTPIIAEAASWYTSSGQIGISNGGNYGLKSNRIYCRGGDQIYLYNRAYAKYTDGFSINGSTSVDQKYVAETWDSGDGKQASNHDVPIYRLSRPGGYTDSDTNLAGVNIIDTDRIIEKIKAPTFVEARKQIG